MNVALGAAWADQRCSEAFGGSAGCSLRGGPAGTTNHQTHECLADMVAQHPVGLQRVDGPPCLLEHGLVRAPPRQEISAEEEYLIEISFGSTVCKHIDPPGWWLYPGDLDQGPHFGSPVADPGH